MVFKRMTQSKAVSNAGRYRGDLLLNRPKQALAVLALHLVRMVSPNFMDSVLGLPSRMV